MLRIFSVCGLAFVMAVATGCDKKSPPGGNVNQAGVDDSFTIEVPRMATTIKAGEQDEVTIQVDRNGDFRSDVKIDLELSSGLSATPASFTLREGHDEQKIVLAAGTDARPSTQAVKVHATPAQGKATETSFEVKIAEPDKIPSAGERDIKLIPSP